MLCSETKAPSSPMELRSNASLVIDALAAKACKPSGPNGLQSLSMAAAAHVPTTAQRQREVQLRQPQNSVSKKVFSRLASGKQMTNFRLFARSSTRLQPRAIKHGLPKPNARSQDGASRGRRRVATVWSGLKDVKGDRPWPRRVHRSPRLKQSRSIGRHQRRAQRGHASIRAAAVRSEL